MIPVHDGERAMTSFLQLGSPFASARIAALSATFAIGLLLADPAAARDPAAVGGGDRDPALVGGYSMPAASAPVGDTGSFSQSTVQRETSIEDAEDLLARLRGQLNGTAIEAPREGEPIGTDTRGRQVNDALRYRNEVDAMVRKHWDNLGPVVRDLYSANYDRSNPYDDSRRYRSPYGDDGQMENKLLGATQDVQQSMQNLEDLLLPLLQDLKQGFDNGLQQRAIRR
jgi:hypothetical protein